jgi:hypothetical protein
MKYMNNLGYDTEDQLSDLHWSPDAARIVKSGR